MVFPDARCDEDRVGCAMTSFRATNTSSSGQRAWTRSATMAVYSTADRTELRLSFGPIGASSTEERDRHFLTVLSLSP